MKICILTAGKGSRMGVLGEKINKALLPIDNKAIISHIIEKFSIHDSYVIALGYKDKQVCDYLKAAHPNRKFNFVKIDNFDGLGSGPGYSLLCCKKYLQESFFFVPSDCFFTFDLTKVPNGNWIGVAKINEKESIQYCNVALKNNTVIDIRDKERCGPEYFAFTGLLFVNDYKEFWTSLRNNTTIMNEHQVSNGLKGLLNGSGLKAVKIKWNDIGDIEKYYQVKERYDSSSITKLNEFIYFVSNRVIKFFDDKKIIDGRIKKAQIKPEIFPRVQRIGDQFYFYPYRSGQTFYRCGTPHLFRQLLKWLEEKVWIPVDVDKKTMMKFCRKFYYEKTTSRINEFKTQNPKYKFPTMINKKPTLALPILLDKIPWKILYQGIPCFIHGDLQFQNILYDENLDEFVLLDWRQDFADVVEFGDLYYDIAKLYGGIIMNYDFIIKGLYEYKHEKNKALVKFNKWNVSNKYKKILDEFIQTKSLDEKKIQFLTGLIYINMAALHPKPFSYALITLGSLIISNNITE